MSSAENLCYSAKYTLYMCTLYVGASCMQVFRTKPRVRTSASVLPGPPHHVCSMHLNVRGS